MPIFEFLCSTCNRIYSFLSLSLTPKREPKCPRCGNTHLRRVPSAFAVASTRRQDHKAQKAASGEGEVPEALERELEGLVANMDEKDMEDPRTMARVMRRLAEASGEPIPETLQEMMQRMEAGEDPEKLEEELGDQLEAELGEEEGDQKTSEGAGPERDPGLYDL